MDMDAATYSTTQRNTFELDWVQPELRGAFFVRDQSDVSILRMHNTKTIRHKIADAAATATSTSTTIQRGNYGLRTNERPSLQVYLPMHTHTQSAWRWIAKPMVLKRTRPIW